MFSRALFLSCLTACAASAQAAVEGDVYLVMKNGDVKAAASNVVFLLPDSVVRATASKICRGLQAELAGRLNQDLIARKRPADSALAVWSAARQADPSIGVPSAKAQGLQGTYLATRDSVRLLAGDWLLKSVTSIAEELTRVGHSSPTGMRAHYHFEGVPAGKYVLWARTALYDTDYYWLARIAVGTSALQRDLDNTIVQQGKVGCAELDSVAPR